LLLEVSVLVAAAVIGVAHEMNAAVGFAAGAGLMSLACYFQNRKESCSKPCDRQTELANIGQKKRFVGVDLGGTTVSVALTDEVGTILASQSQSLPAGKSFDSVTKLIIKLAQQVVREAGCQLGDVTAIGMGAPGNLDCDNGVVINAANFDWVNAPLTATIEKALGRPTFLENDANCAVLAEWWVGAGAGDDIKHIVMFTLGTGVGGGVVSDNRLVRGATGMAGELGHTIIDPNIGNSTAGRLCENTGVHGVLERYASAMNVGARAKELATGPDVSTLATVRDVTAKDVFEHAAAGDKLAQHLVDETAEYLAVGMINACRHFDPQVIVVSGGMALAGDAIMKPIKEHFTRRWWKIQPLSTITIVQACAGNNAGMLGAAATAKLSMEQRR